MPEAYTHIRIARACARRLESSGADAFIRGEALAEAYEMGAQGPDPLFAFRILSRKKPYPMAALADRIHTRQCGAFLRAMVFRAYSPVQRAYTLGFLTHYAADATLHPYVEALRAPGMPFAMPEGHGFCEVALDTRFHESDGLGPAVKGEEVAPPLYTDALAHVCALLHACALEVYGEDVSAEYLADAFHDFRWLHEKIFPATPAKRALVWLAERLVLRRPGYGLSHMTPAKQPPEGFPDTWTDPVTHMVHEGEGPQALCDAVARDAAVYCKAAAAYWQGGADKEHVAMAIGDRSFITGQLSEQAPAGDGGEENPTAAEDTAGQAAGTARDGPAGAALV